ncbi:MAG: histidine triad nucleotide-binding protein [Thermodesulfobacteriota bacterium]
MSSDCLFCKIVSGEIKTEFIYETDDFIVIKDKFPQAPTHLLIIPRRHYRNIIECMEKSGDGMGDGLLRTAVDVAKRLGFAQSGFRSIINTNSGGGQTVFHLHMHVMAGEKLTEDMA